MHPVNEVLRSLSPRGVADTVDRCSPFRYAKPAAFAVQSPSAASLRLYVDSTATTLLRTIASKSHRLTNMVNDRTSSVLGADDG
jgi:hypothetical protein